MAQKDQLQIGHVVDPYPEGNNFRVQVEGYNGVLECTWAGESGGSPGWSREATSLTHGDRVLVYIPSGEEGRATGTSGIILAVLPMEHLAKDGEGELDLIPKSVREMLYPSLSHQTGALDGEGDHDKGQFFYGTDESALPGQWGKANANGGQLSISAFRAMVKACEQAGVESHAVDRLLKVIGYNLHILTGGAVDKRVSDAAEYSEIYMNVPYLWEAKQGALSEGQIGEKVPRYVSLKGYMGDAVVNMVQVPATDTVLVEEGEEDGDEEEEAPSPGDELETETSNPMRLLTEQYTSDGSYYLESTGEVMMGKTGPQQVIRLGDLLCNTDVSLTKDQAENWDEEEHGDKPHSAGIVAPQEDLLGQTSRVDEEVEEGGPTIHEQYYNTPDLLEEEVRERVVTDRVFVVDVTDEGDEEVLVQYDGGDTPTDWEGNYTSFLSREQLDLRRQQRMKALISNRLVHECDSEGLVQHRYSDVIGVDHRGDFRVYNPQAEEVEDGLEEVHFPGPTEAYWQWTSDGTYVLETKNQKWVVGQDTSEFYGNMSIIGDRHFNLVANSVNMRARNSLQVISGGDVHIRGNTTFLENAVRGRREPGETVGDNITVYAYVHGHTEEDPSGDDVYVPGQWVEVTSGSGGDGRANISISDEMFDLRDCYTDIDHYPLQVRIGDAEAHAEAFIAGPSPSPIRYARSTSNVSSDGGTGPVEMLEGGNWGSNLLEAQAPPGIQWADGQYGYLRYEPDDETPYFIPLGVESRSGDPVSGDMWDGRMWYDRSESLPDDDQ